MGMPKNISLVPGAATEPDLVPALVPIAEDEGLAEQYFSREALELVRSLEGKKASDFSEDEILLLALIAAQAALAKYVHPGHRSAESTLNTILGVLDNRQVVCASLHKAQLLLRTRQTREREKLQRDRPKRVGNPYFP